MARKKVPATKSDKSRGAKKGRMCCVVSVAATIRLLCVQLACLLLDTAYSLELLNVAPAIASVVVWHEYSTLACLFQLSKAVLDYFGYALLCAYDGLLVKSVNPGMFTFFSFVHDCFIIVCFWSASAMIAVFSSMVKQQQSRDPHAHRSLSVLFLS